ncbi:MAG: hypothetical protein HY000_39970 [Planctomycetes bacterium]|nr:hypothetical protein [Planctomycetota bacterium]
MSTAYYIVLDKKVPGFDPFVNGKFLAQEAKRLARVIKALGLRQLNDYVSYTAEEARGMIEEMGADAEETELPDEHWFDVDEGLVWVGALAEHLAENPTGVKNSVGVLSDLREYEEVLTRANTVGARWHLAVDF